MAYSQAADFVAQLSGPVGRAIQDSITRQYIAGIKKFAQRFG